MASRRWVTRGPPVEIGRQAITAPGAPDNGAGAGGDENVGPLAGLGLSCWVLSDGKIGDEVPCFGLARALGLAPARHVVRPRAVFAALAPRGPIDWREGPAAPDSPIRPPFPDILIASGRRTIPYLRHVRRAARGATFAIFLKNPRIATTVADLVWAPLHDGLRGDNVIATLTAPHTLGEAALAAARARPDPRIASLPGPRVALLIGGNSNSHRLAPRDVAALTAACERFVGEGASVMITPSRRTPPHASAALADWAAANPARAFFWNGQGANPYVSMLALADAILVTADSTNMVGEAAATCAPVLVYEPSGGHRRLTAYVDALEAAGVVRRFRGVLERWPRTPLDATRDVAQAVAARVLAWRSGRLAHPRDVR